MSRYDTKADPQPCSVLDPANPMFSIRKHEGGEKKKKNVCAGKTVGRLQALIWYHLLP